MKDRQQCRTGGSVETVPDMREASREERFTLMVQEVAEPVRRYLVRRTDPDTAQDVLAETLLVLWRRFDDVPTDGPLPWSYAVSRRCLSNAVRSANRQRRLVKRLTSTQRDDTEPMLDDTELYAALGCLSPKDREVVRLWAWEELAPKEIAVVLGVSANAASIRLHRARKKLADLLDGRQDDGTLGHEQDERRGS